MPGDRPVDLGYQRRAGSVRTREQRLGQVGHVPVVGEGGGQDAAHGGCVLGKLLPDLHVRHRAAPAGYWS